MLVLMVVVPTAVYVTVLNAVGMMVNVRMTFALLACPNCIAWSRSARSFLSNR